MTTTNAAFKVSKWIDWERIKHIDNAIVGGSFSLAIEDSVLAIENENATED